LRTPVHHFGSIHTLTPSVPVMEVNSPQSCGKPCGSSDAAIWSTLLMLYIYKAAFIWSMVNTVKHFQF